MGINFIESLEAVANILENQGVTELSERDILPDSGKPLFDSILFKKLKKWNIIDENASNKKTRDSDIRLEGEERFIFPIYENLLYKEKNEGKGYFKKWFLTKIPFYFLEDNIHYLYSRATHSSFSTTDFNDFSFSSQQKVHLSKENRSTERVFLGYKNHDSKSFTNFRKLLFEDDYLIICKYHGRNEYLLFGAKEGDFVGTKIETNKSAFYHLERNVKSASTSVDIQDTATLDILDNKAPHQRMIVGAPGIGKSFFVKEESESIFEAENITTITFHPRLKYSHFIGAYKPILSDKNIEYGFQPGIFLTKLVEAIKRPNELFLFVIEEINRGEANEIFGDFFQLLERDRFGRSRYTLDVGTDIYRYFETEGVFEDGKAFMPDNLYLWSTCNLNDQQTLSMDNSFIRRWDRTFIAMDHFEGKADFFVSLPLAKKPVPWNDIQKKINTELMKFHSIQEDQLIGPFFIQDDLNEDEFFSNIIVHLKENVLQELSTQMFTHSFLSQLHASYKKGEDIFLAIKWDDFDGI